MSAPRHDRRNKLSFPPEGAGLRSFLIPLAVVFVVEIIVRTVPVHGRAGAGLLGVVAIMVGAALVGAAAVLALSWDRRRSQQD